MKKVSVFFLLLSILTELLADEKNIVWERSYRNASNDDMRYSIVLNIKELHDKSFGPLLTQALIDLIERKIESGDNNEIEAKVNLATAIVRELGELKETSASDQVFIVFQEVKQHPLLNAEAAIALGKMRAIEYAPSFAQNLSHINQNPTRENQENSEIMAFGLVQALGLMKDPSGYEPIFFASIGWYSAARKVKEVAKIALKTMVEDPTDSLLLIVKNQTDFANKLRALEAEDDSRAPNLQKAKVALVCLEEGIRTVPRNIVESIQLANLRKKALEVLIKTEDHSPQAVALYRLYYDAAVQSKDSPEVFMLLRSLGSNASPDAVQFMIDLIARFNERQKHGVAISQFEIQQFRTILQSIKQAANALARPVLLEAQYLYTPALQRDVKAVLAGLPN